ncbi:MAG: hypothetical protein LQ338_007806 [Usnochroma carphineum]|nr:MAG: hypothetical protein LQ338_007806 [Usnochroma carphineum]
MDDVHPQGPKLSPSSNREGTAPEASVDSATAPIEDPEIWPPRGLTNQSVLTYDEAVSLVSHGALLFRAFSLSAHHAIDHHAHFHAFLELSNGHQILEATSPMTLISDRNSFPLDESLDRPTPCNTLEQPSMALAFGKYPGTMTFSRYIGTLNRPAVSVEGLPKVMLRRIDLSQILDRLRFLQDIKPVPFAPNREEEDFLYGQLLLDPDSDLSNGTLDRDIDVLSSILNSSVWIDLSDCRKQFVAKYHTEEVSDASTELFFHQLLLSTELDRRIDLSATCANHSTGHMLSALPRKVAWAVAMSRRFFQNLAFEEVQTATSSRYSLVPQNKFSLMEMVLDLGYALKWPTMEQMEARMLVESEGRAMQCRWTVPSATFLSGTVLPGRTVSWSVLSCLFDCNPAHRLTLGGLEEMRTQSGFQYLSHTYWYWESIVGKVLGAMQGSKNIAGWIGPCILTPDLESVEYVRIYRKKVPERMRKRDLRSIAARSDPLGTLSGSYPVNNFHLVLPNFSKVVDFVRVEKLAVARVNIPSRDDPKYVEHKVAMQFAVEGRSSISLRLRYDVSFIAAAACWAGPHVLFYDYTYKQVCVDKLLHNDEWSGRSGQGKSGEGASTDDLEGEDNDKVLVIEAYGAAENAVLARAW